jgi:hypothetical protein
LSAIRSAWSRFSEAIASAVSAMTLIRLSWIEFRTPLKWATSALAESNRVLRVGADHVDLPRRRLGVGLERVEGSRTCGPT